MQALQLLFLLFCIAFALKAKPCNVLCLLFIILPYHGAIKEIIFHGGGNLFSFWKEIVIAILFVRSFSTKNKQVNGIMKLYGVFGLLCAVFLLIGYSNGFPLATRAKQLFLPLLIVTSSALVKMRQVDLRKVLMVVVFASVIVNLTIVLDFLSPELRLIMRTIMGVDFTVASDGTLLYEVTSYKIMGHDRACGLMGGGPNQTGVFESGVLMAGIYLVMFHFKQMKSKFLKISLLSALVLACFCWIVCFSRAGWAIIGITFFIVCLFTPKMRGLAIKLAVLGLLFGVVCFYTIDIFQDVIVGTLSGDEASSAERGNMTKSSWDFLISNPMGYGIGASDHSVDNYVAFAESSMINFGIDVGIFGVALLSYIYFTIALCIYRNMRRSRYAMIGLGFCIAHYIASWVSVNPFENPFMMYAFFYIGLSMNKYLFIPSIRKRKKWKPEYQLS